MPDPTEVDRPTRRPARSTGLKFAGLLLCALLTAVAFGQLANPDSSRLPGGKLANTIAADPVTAPELGFAPDLASAPDLGTTSQRDNPIGAPSLRRCATHLGGLALGRPPKVTAWAIERWDCDAPKGPWSVVIRGAGGHFGVHGAVVTFPVESFGTGTPAPSPQGALWDPGLQRLVWPMAGAQAQIVGDVGQARLADLARNITIEGGRPQLRAMREFSTAAAIPYRSAVVHEMRYSTTELGQQGKLGVAHVYTGATQGAAFESQAFGTRAKPAGLVRGRPAIYFEVSSGNGTLAWEPAPGEVTYIGVSDSLIRADAVETLRALADGGRALTPAQWQTKDRIPTG